MDYVDMGNGQTSWKYRSCFVTKTLAQDLGKSVFSPLPRPSRWLRGGAGGSGSSHQARILQRL